MKIVMYKSTTYLWKRKRNINNLGLKWSGGHSQSLAANKFFPLPFQPGFQPPPFLPSSHPLSPDCRNDFKSAWVKRKGKNEEPRWSPDQRFCHLVHLQCANESSTSYWSMLKLPMLEVHARSRGAEGRPQRRLQLLTGSRGTALSSALCDSDRPEGTAWRCVRGGTAEG